MKRSALWIFSTIILLAVLLTACQSSSVGTGSSADRSGATDDSLNKIKAAGKFVVGLDDNFPPMGFRDEKGEIVGFDIDMAKEAAKRMGVNVEFKPVDWDGIIMSLNNGDIDVIWNGLTITDKRKEEINFTKPYLTNRQIIVVRKDSNINSKADLAGKIVGLQMGSSSEEALNNDEKTAKSLGDTRRYPDNVGALMDLASGRIDAVVVDEVVGRYYIAEKADTYRILKDNFGEEQYGVGVRKSDKAFLQELDRVLDEMKADGTAAKISKEWFGDDIVLK